MRTKIEIIGVAVLLVVGALYGHEMYLKAIRNAVAIEKAKIDQAAEKKIDDRLQKLDDADKTRQTDYEKKSSDLAKMPPQQIVKLVPQYIPLAPAPVSIVAADSQIAKTGEAKAGDAIVPEADIQPIAQAVLDGAKCKGDLAACSTRVQDWQEKYEKKSDEAKQWETVAKGGSVLKRVVSTVLKVGVGVLAGTAAVCATGHCK